MFAMGDQMLKSAPTSMLPVYRKWKSNPELAPNCPRCASANTKFCYYNNYNLSQPRHFCKNCRRYWTKGGSIRNIPVGGGTRKNAKRPSSSNDSNPSKRQPNPAPDDQKLTDPSPPPPTSSTISKQVLPSLDVQNSVSDADQTRMYVMSLDHRERNMMDSGGSFSSLLTSSGQFGDLLNGLNPNGPGSKTLRTENYGENLASGRVREPGSDREPRLRDSSHNNNEETEGSYLSVHGDGSGGDHASCWTGSSNGWPDLVIYTPGSNFH